MAKFHNTVHSVYDNCHEKEIGSLCHVHYGFYLRGIFLDGGLHACPKGHLVDAAAYTGTFKTHLYVPVVLDADKRDVSAIRFKERTDLIEGPFYAGFNFFCSHVISF